MNYWNLEIVTEPRRRRPVEVMGKDEVLLEIFERVAGEDGVVDALELRDLLEMCFRQTLGDYKFSLESCRSMVQLHDLDKSGYLDFGQFCHLWKEIKICHSVFKKDDTDHSNDMDTNELLTALEEADVKLSREALAIFKRRYANREGNINLDDFFQIVARTKCLTRSFKRVCLQTEDMGEKASFGVEGYIEANIVI